MKRIVALLVFFCMCFSLTACGMSEEAKAVDQLILEIGEVTLDSGDTINEVKAKYDALPEEQQEKLKNSAVLSKAIEKYDQLVVEEEKRLEDIRLEEIRLEELRRQTIQKNYCKILQWIADHGEATYSDDVNSYGEVDSYSYENYSFYTRNGKVDDSCVLRIKEKENRGDETIGPAYVQRYIERSLRLDVEEDSFEYDWGAYANIWFWPDCEVIEQAGGEIQTTISEFSTKKTDYYITGYEEREVFREDFGISDVRTKINKDMQSDVSMFADFIKKKVGVTLRDIGFEKVS